MQHVRAVDRSRFRVHAGERQVMIAGEHPLVGRPLPPCCHCLRSLHRAAASRFVPYGGEVWRPRAAVVKPSRRPRPSDGTLTPRRGQTYTAARLPTVSPGRPTGMAHGRGTLPPGLRRRTGRTAGHARRHVGRWTGGKHDFASPMLAAREKPNALYGLRATLPRHFRETPRGGRACGAIRATVNPRGAAWK